MSSLLPQIVLLLGLNLGLFTFVESPNSFPEQSLLPPIWAHPQSTGLHIGQHQLDHEQFGSSPATFVNISDYFPIYRYQGFESGGLGGVYTQFLQPDGLMEDRILLNSDYQIGFYAAYQSSNRIISRVALIHQSSHLGDEYVYASEEENPGSEVNLSNFSEDQLELFIGRQDNRSLAYIVYARSLAGERFANENFDDNLFVTQQNWSLGYQRQYGLRAFAYTALLVAAEATHYQSRANDFSLSIKTGLWQRKTPTARVNSLLALEYYRGPSSFSEFIEADGDYYGLSYTLTF